MLSLRHSCISQEGLDGIPLDRFKNLMMSLPSYSR